MEITATIQSKCYTLSKTTSLRGWCKLAYNKSKIVDGLHFDISKKSATSLRIWHDGAYWPSEPYGQLKFSLKKIQDGGQPPFWKIENSPYLSNGFTDWHEIRQCDSLVHSNPPGFEIFNLLNSKMAVRCYIINKKSPFLHERHYATAVLTVIVCLSVCLSVRLSDTSRCSTKTAKPKITQTMPYDSPSILVFWCERTRRNSNGFTPNRGNK